MRSCFSLSKFKSSKRPKPTYATILDLPMELILQIIDELNHDPIPIACLALTCHAFANLFSNYLKHPSLRFPVRASLEVQDAYYYHKKRIVAQPISTRQQFLRLLAQGRNNRWAYCSRCLKLHPVKHFSFRQLHLRSAKSRYCRLGRYSTVVDVCPGVVVSFPQKKDLIAAIKRQGTVDICRNNPAKEYRLIRRYNVYVKIKTRVVARIHDENELVIAVRHQWIDSKISVARLRNTVSADYHVVTYFMHLCPHMYVDLDQIEEAVKTGVNPELTKQGCTYCKTGFKAGRDGSTYWADISLYLGTGDHDLPDKAWLDHANSYYYRYLGSNI
ncbi:hypothetical protein BJX66DRAFT_335800 [Aspergillus keveii]|uniref:F-box domain-containing protein n=1 Tax=Aspergillus keveii TaxID=714993 RepID=A0ABR4GBZ7_9EURO